MTQFSVRACFAAASILFSAFAVSQSVDVINVTGKGISDQRTEAVARALTEAVGKVNPSAVSAIDEVVKSSKQSTVKLDGTTATQSSRTKETFRAFSQATEGVIKSWDIVSETLNERRQYEIIITADVFRLVDSAQLNRKRISVLPLSNGDDNLNSILVAAIKEGLVKSRKFAVLQDNNQPEIQSFVENIRANGRIEDQVRLRGTAAPEVIVVAGLENLVDAGSRLRGNVSLEIIDYSSGQVKYRNSLPILLRFGDQAGAQRRLQTMGAELGKQLIAHIYPPLVVGWNGESMTLGLGDGFFSKGDVVQVHESLGGIRDPYTGEFLEENLRPMCEAVVQMVSSRIALAKPRGVCGAPFLVNSMGAIGDLETRMFVAVRVDYGTSTSPPSPSTSLTKKGNKSSDFDGLFKTD